MVSLLRSTWVWVLCLCCLVNQVLGVEPYQDLTFKPSIKTVQLFREGKELTLPILYLNEDARLVISFDDLVNKPKDYWIKLIHCEYDWTPSSLLAVEYFDGFQEERLTTVQPSRGTRVHFIHYEHTFPRDNYRFKHSGNYALVIYDADRPEQPVITRRFLVAENAAGIASDAGLSFNTAQRMRLQAVNFKVLPRRLQVMDVHQDVKVCLMQNFRWDTRKTDLKPVFITPDSYEYRFDAAADFEGGNEFRQFDIRNLTAQLGRVQQMDLNSNGPIQVTLNPDFPRTNNVYQKEFDLNGFYLIDNRAQRGNPALEADYVQVEFLLKVRDGLDVQDVYILGKLTDWQPLPEARLAYEPPYYRGSLLLKQGFYNYIYASRTPQGLNETMFEGSHAETENFYTILVYYKSYADRATRLVGCKNLNFLE
jgi:hypothetical protein